MRALSSTLRRNAFGYEVEALHLFRRRVRGNTPVEVTLPAQVRFEAITLDHPDGVAAVAAAWPPEWRAGRSEADLRSHLEHDLRAGDECFALWHEDKVIAAGWASRRNGAGLPAYTRACPLHRKEALRRTTFVVPAYQGDNLQTQLGLLIQEQLVKTHGIETCYAFVGIRNVASERNATRIYEERRVVYHARLTVFGLCFDLFPSRRRNEWRPCRPVMGQTQPSDGSAA